MSMYGDGTRKELLWTEICCWSEWNHIDSVEKSHVVTELSEILADMIGDLSDDLERRDSNE